MRLQQKLIYLLSLLFAAMLSLSSASASGPVTGDYPVVFIRVTYTDSTTRLADMTHLNQAAGELHNFFSELSFGALNMRARFVDVALSNILAQYWYACPTDGDREQYCVRPDLANEAAELAGAAGIDFVGVKAVTVLSPCDVHGPYNNFTSGGDSVFNSPRAHATVHQAFDTECAGTAGYMPPGPSGVWWSGWAHELGHTLQLEGHDLFDHPSGYSSGYDLMDSCYPCGDSVYSLSGNPVVSDLARTSMPGYLPSSKTIIIPRPAAGTAGGTYVLEPVSKPSPSATAAPRGIKIPLGSDHYYIVEARTRVAADSHNVGPG